MIERFKFQNKNGLAFLLPWILFPLVLDFNIIVGVFVFIAISFLFWIFTSKTIIFYDDKILVKKYKWFFEKQNSISYNGVSLIYFTIITLSASYNSTFTIHLIKGGKEKVTFYNEEFDKFKIFLTSKSVKIKSNNNNI